ncbi:MAG: hypothetical protein AB3N28_04935 [Kordiimonas sp.]
MITRLLTYALNQRGRFLRLGERESSGNYKNAYNTLFAITA